MGAASRVRPEPDPRTAPTQPALPAADEVSPEGALPLLPGDYSLRERVHVSSSSELWRAVDADGHAVAIKLGRSATADASLSFTAEARALATLTHRSIVRLLGHGETSDQRPFLALEWLEGTTLRALLAERGAGIPPSDAIRLLLPIASALVLAHDRGFVHGAVTPDSVFVVVRKDEHVLPKLVDFSNASRAAVTPPRTPANAPTPRQAEPEGCAQSPKVDVQGFASTIFFAITGRTPFAPSSSPGSSFVPRTGLSERDAALWRVLAEGLAPPPLGRFARVQDFARELAVWADLRGLDADITGSPISARWLRAAADPSPSGNKMKP
ncbi:MAG: protein kinase [Polyangiaceae bacterium]